MSGSNECVADPVREIITILSATRDEIGDEAGISAASLYAWKVGRRVPRDHSRAALARVARTRALRLLQLAHALGQENGHGPGERNGPPEAFDPADLLGRLHAARELLRVEPPFASTAEAATAP